MKSKVIILAVIGLLTVLGSQNCQKMKVSQVNGAIGNLSNDTNTNNNANNNTNNNTNNNADYIIDYVLVPNSSRPIANTVRLDDVFVVSVRLKPLRPLGSPIVQGLDFGAPFFRSDSPQNINSQAGCQPAAILYTPLGTEAVGTTLEICQYTMSSHDVSLSGTPVFTNVSGPNVIVNFPSNIQPRFDYLVVGSPFVSLNSTFNIKVRVTFFTQAAVSSVSQGLTYGSPFLRLDVPGNPQNINGQAQCQGAVALYNLLGTETMGVPIEICRYTINANATNSDPNVWYSLGTKVFTNLPGPPVSVR